MATLHGQCRLAVTLLNFVSDIDIKQDQLLDGATILGVILSSDKTNLASMTGGRVIHPLLISLANLVMDFHAIATNHTFQLLALLPVPKFIHKDRKTCGVLENQLIHKCLDFILKPLKKAAEISIMLSDPVGSLRYAYTPLAAYIVDVAEAECYNFSYFVLFTYVFSLFLEVSHGALL